MPAPIHWLSERCSSSTNHAIVDDTTGMARVSSDAVVSETWWCAQFTARCPSVPPTARATSRSQSAASGTGTSPDSSTSGTVMTGGGEPPRERMTCFGLRRATS